MLFVIYICRDLSVLSGPHPPPCGPLTLKYKFKIWVTHMTVRGEAYATFRRKIFKTHLVKEVYEYCQTCANHRKRTELYYDM